MSKCKGQNGRCILISGHLGKCRERLAEPTLSNQPVTTQPVTCNQCVTKDEEIERLRNQVEELKHDLSRHMQIASNELPENRKPKRDRAAYMRAYRKKPLGVPYG